MPSIEYGIDKSGQHVKAKSAISKAAYTCPYCYDGIEVRKMAKSREGKVLLPSRVHLMFKGLNGIYACINANCQHHYDVNGITLGNICENSEFRCSLCGSRVFELMADRRCGTLFLRGFVEKHDLSSSKRSFLWHKKSSLLSDAQEVHLWLMPKDRDEYFKINKSNRRTKAHKNSKIAYLNCTTGANSIVTGEF